MSKVQNIVQFAVERGLVTDHDVMSHIHAGLRSKPTSKSYDRNYERELARLQKARDETAQAYKLALESGEVIQPPKPTLEEVAQGNPESTATQAAKRILEKRKQRLGS